MTPSTARLRILAASVLALAVALTACVPTAGRPAVEFQAAAEDVISEIAIFAVGRQPDPNMNFYSVEAIGDRFVTVTAESTLGFTLFLGRMETRLTFTAQQRGDVTVLAGSGRGTNAAEELDRFILHLSSVFPRL
jgi:hypothetical protein